MTNAVRDHLRKLLRRAKELHPMTTTESLRRQLNDAFADHQHFHFLIDESWPALDRALAAAATLEQENARLKHIIYRLALGARIINAALSGKTLDQETEAQL